MRAILIIPFILASPVAAFAFQNIEADFAYQNSIKFKIFDEFKTGMKLLLVQAERLGMAVRRKDVDTLKAHMYDKAFMMARCLDDAMTDKKMRSKNVSVDARTERCIDTHTKFMNWFNSPAREQWLRSYSGFMDPCDTAELFNNPRENEPYDFLQPLKSLQIDWVQRRACYLRVGAKLPE